jgi:hypothetical protein
MSKQRSADRAQLDVEHSERCYLRFGALPKDKTSHGGIGWSREKGVSAYRGYKEPGGRYALDIPCDPGQRDQLVLIFGLILQGRPVYVMSGTEIGRGRAGEPLLKNVTAKAVPSFVEVGLPHWLGPQGRELEKEWNKWRRSARQGRGRRPLGLQKQAALALEEGLDRMFPFRTHSIPTAVRRSNAEDLISMFTAGGNRRAARRSFKAAR